MERSMKGMIKTLIVGAVLATLSLGASLYAAEAILWHLNPKNSLPKNGRLTNGHFTWGHPVRTNSYNARGPEPSVEKEEAVFRVLAFGDSLTWGAGVAEEERYTEVAEVGLAKRDLPQPVEILNFARS